MSKLFEYFDAVDRGDFSFIDTLSDDDIKDISPYVLLGWFNGAKSDRNIHTVLTDVYCNEYVFPLSKHPRLLLNLFMSANCNISRSGYKFAKSVTKKETKLVKTIAGYYQCSIRDAKDYLDILDDSDIKKIEQIMVVK